jgi:xanthine dehydrogenase accessory factor
MSELARVAAALRDAARSGDECVLATVVRTEGSTYRRPGARLVVRAGSVRAGAVSAGCLENDVLARAAQLHAAHSPEIVTYDTRSPEDIVWGFGLGCGGLVEVLLEPLDPPRAAMRAAALDRVASLRQPTVLATITRAPSGLGVAPGDHPPLPLPPSLARADIEIAYEYIVPPVRLAVCGAGPDAVPVVAAAKRVGWDVTVIDNRPSLARAAQFQDADHIIVAEPNRIAAAVNAADCDAAVVMSHNFERDLAFVGAWLAAGIPYVGVLGPRLRTDQMLATLAARGTALDDDARRRIHAPAGLDLGAETADEIALAIVAEVQAMHAGRPAGFLSQRDGPIHLTSDHCVPSSTTPLSPTT